jgi:hypothetical protein
MSSLNTCVDVSSRASWRSPALALLTMAQESTSDAVSDASLPVKDRVSIVTVTPAVSQSLLRL